VKKTTIKKAIKTLADAPRTALHLAIETAETAEERAELIRLAGVLFPAKKKEVKDEEKTEY